MSFIFLKQVWTSDCLKQVLPDTQQPGSLPQTKNQMWEKPGPSKESLEMQEKEKNTIRDLGNMVLSKQPSWPHTLAPTSHVYLLMSFWISLLLQVHWYMAKLIIPPKLDIKGKRQRKRKATFSNKQKTLLCKLLILSTPQSLQNGTFDCRQCWQPKSSKATRCRGMELQSLECLPERHARIKQL